MKEFKLEEHLWLQILLLLVGMAILLIMASQVSQFYHALVADHERHLPDVMDSSISERLQPIGHVAASNPDALPAPVAKAKTGKQVVEAVCIHCHGAGVLGAPKIGSHSLWAPHYAKGIATLLDHAEHGFKNMPARGGDPSLSNQELKNAILYMLGQSGFHPS
ncbi:MAG: c-type cytochrome [Gammaproteobacteria bacterium]